MSDRKKVAVVLFLCVPLLVASAIGCAGPAAEKASIKIPQIGAFSHPTLASWETTITEGVELYVSEINKKGGIDGRKVEIYRYDDQFDLARATTLFLKAVTEDKALVVMAGFSSTMAGPYKKLAEDEKIAFMARGTTLESLADPVSPWTFGIAQAASAYCEAMVALAVKEGYKKPAIMHGNYAYGLDGQKSLIKYLAEAGIKPVADVSSAIDATTLTPQLLELRKANPDLILTYMMIGEYVLFAKGLQDLGWKPPVITCLGAAVAEYIERGGAAPEWLGARISGTYDSGKAEYKAFDKAFREQFGKPMGGPYTLMGYSAMEVVCTAIKNAKVSYDPANIVQDRAKIRDAMEKIDRLASPAWKENCYISFSPTKHRAPTPMKDSVVFTVVKGKEFVTYR